MPPKRVPFRAVPYPLVGGVDTKISGLVLPAPKLIVCENAYSDRTGSLQRRPGRTAFTTVVQPGAGVTFRTPAAVLSYRDNLVVPCTHSSLAGASGGLAFEYSNSLDRWIAKGSVESARVRTLNVAKGGAEAGIYAGDSATANGITVHAYEEHEVTGGVAGSSVKVTVTDANGTVLKKAHTLFTAAFNTLTGVKCVALSNRIYVFWYDFVLTDLRVAIFNATSASTLGSMEPTPVTVTGDIDHAVRYPLFDVCANSTYGIFVVWNDNTATRLSFGFVSTTGTLGSTSTTAIVAEPWSLGCDVAPDLAMHGIVYSVRTTPNDVYAMHRSWSGAAWTATATSGALDTALTGVVINSACRYQDGASTTLRVFYTESASYDFTRQATYTTAAAASSRVAVLPHSWLSSKPVLGADSQLYYWVLSDDGPTKTQFFMRQDNVVVAKAIDVHGSRQGNVDPVTLPQIERTSDSYATSQPYLSGAVTPTGGVSPQLSLRRTTVELVHAEAYASVEAGESLYMAGGYLQQYDGESFVESNFMLPMDSDTVADPTPSAGGGTKLTLLAIYAYQFIYEWTNIRGERELGTNFGAKTCPALTGANNQLSFVLPTLSHTRKKSPRGDVVIAVYRTLANPGEDAPHYRVGQVANDPDAATVTFLDTISDATAATSEQFYQDSGELENTAPPTGHLVATGNGRVFVAGIADLPNTVVPSKTRVFGRALEFSDFLPRIECPEAGGAITALAVMNETLVIFKEARIYRVRGDGPNNLGFGEFFPPELVSADTGTVNARSVVATPAGVMFEGVKGKMLLDQSFQLHYIGAPLEKLSAPGTCVGATLVPLQQQVRFSYASTTHVYDYYHQQWYVFTHGSSGPTTLRNDALVAIAGGTSLVYEDSAVWSDSGTDYKAALLLGWARDPSTLQGDLRIRQIGLTGESLAAHKLQVAIYYDFGTAVAQQIFESIAGAGVLKQSWRVKRQLCNSMQIRIVDDDAGGAVTAGAGFRLNELVFEIIDVRAGGGLGRES